MKTRIPLMRLLLGISLIQIGLSTDAGAQGNFMFNVPSPPVKMVPDLPADALRLPEQGPIPAMRPDPEDSGTEAGPGCSGPDCPLTNSQTDPAEELLARIPKPRPKPKHRYSVPASLAYRCGKGKSTDPLTCLACNNYNEAESEGYESMKAVAKVVLARVQSPYFKNSACGAVYEKGEFSWTGPKYRVNGRLVGGVKPRPRSAAAKRNWKEAIRAAVDALNEGPKINGRLYTFYHGDYIATPRWGRSSNCRSSRLVAGSRHIFYSCNGLPNGVVRRAVAGKPKKGSRRG